MRIRRARPRVGPWIWLLPAIVALLGGLQLNQPSVFPDEVGAIGNARHLIGQSPASPWWYLPGYGALLVPVVASADEPGAIVRGVQLVNAVLLVFSAAGLTATLGHLRPETQRSERLTAAALTMALPSYLYFAAFAIADNLLVTLASWLVPFAVWLNRTRAGRAAPVGFVVAVLMATVHSRSIVLPVAVAISLFLSSRTRLLTSASVLLGSMVGRVLAGSSLTEGSGSALSGTGRQSIRALVGDNLAFDALVSLPATAFGQIFSVAIGTLGVVVVGAIALGKGGLQRCATDPARAVVVVSVLGAFGSAVLFTNGGAGDFALYARYLEVAVPVLVAVGWSVVLDGGRIPIWLAPAVAATGLLLRAWRGVETFDGRIQRLNVAGLAPYIELGDGLQPVWLGILGGLAIAVFAFLIRVRAVLGVLAALAVGAAAYADDIGASRSFIDAAGGPPALVDALDAIDADDGCVALDQTDSLDFWFEENLRLHRLDADFPFWATGETVPPCSDIVVSSRTEIGLDGWLPVAVEPGRPHWLWASPAARDRYFLEPLVAGSVAVPLEDPSASIVLEVVSMAAEELVVKVTIHNGSDEVFVPAANLAGGIGGIQIGLEWRSLDAPGVRRSEPLRLGLEGLLHPGDETELVTRVDLAPIEELGSAAILRAELVQEGVGWYSEVNDAVVVEAAP